MRRLLIIFVCLLVASAIGQSNRRRLLLSARNKEALIWGTPTNNVDNLNPIAYYVPHFSGYSTNSGLVKLPDLWTNHFDLTNGDSSSTWPIRTPAALNGKDILNFAPVTKYLRSVIYTSAQPREVIMVARFPVSIANAWVQDGTNGSATFQQFQYNGSWRMNAGSAVVTGVPLVTNVWGIWDLSFNGSTSAFITNAVTVVASANAGNNNMAGMTLGALNSKNFGSGLDFAAEVDYATNLTTAQRVNVYDYFAGLFGLPLVAQPCLATSYLLTFDTGQPEFSLVSSNSLAAAVVSGASGWNYSFGAGPENFITTNAHKSLVNPVTICTTTSMGSTNSGLFSSMTNAAVSNQITFSFPTLINGRPYNTFQASAGLWFKHTFPDTLAGANDWYTLVQNNGGEFCNAKIQLNGGGTYQTITMEGGGADVTPPVYTPGTINITNNTWYWLTILYSSTTNSNHQIWIYGSNLNLLGTISNVPPCDVITNVTHLIIGNASRATNQPWGIYIDNIKIDISANPVFPLLP